MLDNLDEVKGGGEGGARVIPNQLEETRSTMPESATPLKLIQSERRWWVGWGGGGGNLVTKGDFGHMKPSLAAQSRLVKATWC